jgi:ABC-type transport system substrate-binding protein
LAVSPTTTFTEGVEGQPQSFLSSQAKSQTDKTISKLIFRGLFRYDIYGILQPDLAESWTISDEGKTYTIKLKDNQYWSDGKRITSDDLIYTSFKGENLKEVSTDKVDDLTVRYSLPNKFSPFLSLLTIGIIPINSEETANPLMPVSSGQFKIVNVEKAGPVIKSVTLYNSKGGAKYKKLVFKYYPSGEEIQTATKLGEVDGFISNTKFEAENFKEYKFPLQSVYYSLFFNLTNDKFKDVEVRKAFEKVLPIEDIIYGDGITVEGAISRSIFTDKSLSFNKYDKAFSSKMKSTDVTITIPDIDAQIVIAEKVKRYWEDKLNINVKIIKKNSK